MQFPQRLLFMDHVDDTHLIRFSSNFEETLKTAPNSAFQKWEIMFSLAELQEKEVSQADFYNTITHFTYCSSVTKVLSKDVNELFCNQYCNGDEPRAISEL